MALPEGDHGFTIFPNVPLDHVICTRCRYVCACCWAGNSGTIHCAYTKQAAAPRSVNTGLYVVMGVSGSGKSLIGSSLAQALGIDFVEGDDYHPAENIERMSAGIPLTDADRTQWLRSLAAEIGDAQDAGRGLVVSCSALKRSYRDVLRAQAPGLRFVLLRGSRALLAERLAGRRGHYMPSSLLDSQVATLEEPSPDEEAWVCDITESPQNLVAALVARASV
jgi:gluconokinase